MAKKLLFLFVYCLLFFTTEVALAQSQAPSTKNVLFFKILSPINPVKNWVNITAEVDGQCRFVKKSNDQLVSLYWSITQSTGQITSESLADTEMQYFSFDLILSEPENTLIGTMPGLGKQGLSGKFIFHSESGPAGCNVFTELNTVDEKTNPVQMIVQQIKPEISFARALFSGKLDSVAIKGFSFDGREVILNKTID
jgi:hypothetical protein